MQNHDHEDGLGAELWRSDLTVGGTRLVKDIAPGAADGDPSSLSEYNGEIYFAADDSVHGVELWASDGTPAGTSLFLDIHAGAASSHAQNLTPCGEALYFSASDGHHGHELWVTDGTTAGTLMLKDMTPGAADSAISSLDCRQSTTGASLLFFVVGTASDHVEWISDATPEGTRPMEQARTEPSRKEEL